MPCLAQPAAVADIAVMLDGYTAPQQTWQQTKPGRHL
jgi:hypothetical protein